MQVKGSLHSKFRKQKVKQERKAEKKYLTNRKIRVQIHRNQTKIKLQKVWSSLVWKVDLKWKLENDHEISTNELFFCKKKLFKFILYCFLPLPLSPLLLTWPPVVTTLLSMSMVLFPFFSIPPPPNLPSPFQNERRLDGNHNKKLTKVLKRE